MTSRRTFLQGVAAAGGAAIIGRTADTDWKKQPGLELYTVRDLTGKDYEGTLAKVAEIGYKEVEPATDYGHMEPKQFRALLDRYGLTAPSTHVAATEGPTLEQQLEGFQIMGIRYTEVKARGDGGRPGEESVKRTAAQVNHFGQVVQKFGMKMLIHNHTEEFQPIPGSSLLPYDILLAETDPALVAMQLDIGWASVAGRNIREMFRKSPGRFELWHVKDARGIKTMTPKMTQTQRKDEALLVPVGQGEVHYKALFADAELAGLKHYAIEQDNAADWGDSMAAARVSLRNLMKLLS